MKLMTALLLSLLVAGCYSTPVGDGPPPAGDAGMTPGLRLVRSGFVVVMGGGSIEPWGLTARSDAGAIASGLKRIVSQ